MESKGLRYRLNEAVILNEEKLFLNDVHLFNCSTDAIEFIRSASDLTEKNAFFNANELYMQIKDIEAIKIEKDRMKYIKNLLKYLTSCGVLQVEAPMFEIADNEKALEIIRAAIGTSGISDTDQDW